MILRFSSVSIFSQTKSCSSFPEWLRLSFRPDRIFWDGEVRLCSTVNVLGDWLCPTLCLSFIRVVVCLTWHAAASFWEDFCLAPDDVAVAGEVSPNMYCATSEGLSETFTLLSVAWWGWRAFSQQPSKFWECLCVSGSGEELRLLSALPGHPTAGATDCLGECPGLESRAPGLWWRWYFTGCLVKR